MKSLILTTLLIGSISAANAINCEICNDLTINGDKTLYWYVGGLTGDIEVLSEDHGYYTTHNMTDPGEFTAEDVNVLNAAFYHLGTCREAYLQEHGVELEQFSIQNVLNCDFGELQSQVNQPLKLRTIILNLITALEGSDMEDFVDPSVMFGDVIGCLINSIPGPGSICNETGEGDDGGNLVDDGAGYLLDSLRGKESYSSDKLRISLKR